MRSFTLTLLLALFILSKSIAQIVTIGPMLHFNIGDGHVKSSIALEVGYWNFDHTLYGLDFGIEKGKDVFRIYSEFQKGIGIMGVSVGPYLEVPEESTVKLGLQGSAWANYYLGLDLRFRVAKGPDYFAPGIYLKFPWLIDGQQESSGSNHHYDFD